MKLTILGTGTPAPSLKRACSGYMIEADDDLIIMDHGPDAHRRLLESGKRATAVTHAFFTHLHYDHCLDYARLVLQRWDMGAGEIPELQVFGPAPISRMTDQLFGDDGVYGPDIAARVGHQLSLDIYELRGGVLPRAKPVPVVKEISAGDKVDGNGWTVTVAKASHVQPFLECHAYRLDSPDGSICYTGDSGSVSEDIIRLAENCDVLIHMTHFEAGTEPSPEYRAGCGAHLDVAKVAARAGVGTLILSHVLAHIDRPGIRERLINEVTSEFSGRVIWAEDLMEIQVVSETSSPSGNELRE
ncbi:MAG: MBL fold metallo-hydrolase [Rhodospirillaceae bacterium]|nr:MBL fold metallo-hydrolase [Rhodospirillaceae bacterium]